MTARTFASHVVAVSALLMSMAVADGHAQPQRTPEQPRQPAFRAGTDVVVVPFQVRRGSRPVSDLTPAEVILLDEGVPRAFTGFEAPSNRPSLELVVMFDVTGGQRPGMQPPAFWTNEHLYEFAGAWNEAMSRALFEEDGATVRVSIYQFNQSRLRRLVRSTSDPAAVLGAMRRLSEPIPASEALDLQLPADTVIRTERPVNSPAWPFSLAAAMTAFQDSAIASATGARALAIFSTGAEGTSIRPEDLADRALAADVRVYPVALPSIQPIWYEGDDPNIQWEYQPPSGPPQTVVGPRLAENGICHDFQRRGRAPLDSELSDCPLNPPFKAMANWTGGRSFEAARRPGAKLPQSAADRFLGRFSMTASQVNDILDAVKAHALSRFTSTYRVWFEPPPSVSPRKHRLEVKLVEKSRGSVTDGKKSATY